MVKYCSTILFVLIIFVPSTVSSQLNSTTLNESPSEIRLDSASLHLKIDSILTNGIKNEAFPGANVLVAKNGKVIYHKAFGFHTYDSIQPVQPNALYDLASVTKILGPLPALMKLVEDGKLELDAPFSTYWRPWRKRKDKKHLTLREILAHQAGLQPYIVFLNKVKRKNGQLKKRFVRTTPSKRFQKQAYDKIYLKNRFEQKVWRTINRSKVSEDKTYRYSGLSFLIFPKLIEQLTGQSYETYLQDHFYGPIGANTLGYTPRLKNLQNEIIPTEIDTLFRQTTTKGWVHDENAALLGGVSGNAGLFGTANDVFRMMQFYQNLGQFEGQQLLKKETLKEFTSIQYPENENRRGLGFDKPLIGNDTLNISEAYPAPLASSKSFGHAGFTGTFVWADPENQLVFIFLSNRVHPFRSHHNLYGLNIRTALHQVFYEATK